MQWNVLCCEVCMRPLPPDSTFQYGLRKRLDSMTSRQTLGFATSHYDHAQVTGISTPAGMWASVLCTPVHPRRMSTHNTRHTSTHVSPGSRVQGMVTPSLIPLLEIFPTKEDWLKCHCSKRAFTFLKNTGCSCFFFLPKKEVCKDFRNSFKSKAVPKAKATIIL